MQAPRGRGSVQIMHMHCQHTPARAHVAVRVRVAYSARACAGMHMHALRVDLLGASNLVVTPPSTATLYIHVCGYWRVPRAEHATGFGMVT